MLDRMVYGLARQRRTKFAATESNGRSEKPKENGIVRLTEQRRIWLYIWHLNPDEIDMVFARVVSQRANGMARPT